MLSNESDPKKHGFVLVLYLFRVVSSFKSEKGGTAKLSRTGFFINTCTAKLQETHS